MAIRVTIDKLHQLMELLGDSFDPSHYEVVQTSHSAPAPTVAPQPERRKRPSSMEFDLGELGVLGSKRTARQKGGISPRMFGRFVGWGVVGRPVVGTNQRIVWAEGESRQEHGQMIDAVFDKINFEGVTLRTTPSGGRMIDDTSLNNMRLLVPQLLKLGVIKVK